MLIYLSMLVADKHIPMFSWTNLLFQNLSVDTKVIFNLTNYETRVNIWHERDTMGWNVNKR